MPELALEKHYTVKQAAELWNVSRDTIIRQFRDRPGVLKLGHRDRKNKRTYVKLLIPESVLRARHAELHGKVAA